jgi:ElaB/YqjD/DUF883 family membrane-anchored ribosome-binding protein
MRYHLESTLPINAFQPLGGKHSPFKQRMTLEGGGGGGGGVFSSVTNAISDVLGTSGSGGGILGGLAEFDKGVSNVIPGGWGTIGTAVATYFGGPLGAAAAQGIEGAVKGEDWDKTLKDMAIATAAAYASQGIAEGLSSGAETAPVTDYSTLSDAAMQESLEQAIKLPTEVPYVPDEASPYLDGTPPSSYSAPVSPDTLPKGYDPSTEILDTDYSVSQPQGIRSLVAESGVDPTSLGGRADPFVGVYPTSNVYTDLPVGYEFMGPNGMEVVGPNGKTYLQKDLYEALSDRAITPAPTSPDLPSFSETVSLKPDSTPIPLESPTGYTPTLDEEIKSDAFFNDLINKPQATYTPEGVQIFDRSAPADAATQKMVETGMLDRLGQLPGAAYDMAKSYVVNNPYTSAGLGLGALALANAGQQPSPSPIAIQSTGSTGYTGGYGSSGGVASPYLLRNRVNAANVYDYENPYDRYATVNRRYAKGGEVKHFAFGGISNALTRAFQPVEKAVLQPIGQAVPFIREVAPYAGILAAPFIGSPVAATGIGALSSGFGRPGSGFDMKRALMGGIAAYGASTFGAGLEAAGGKTAPVDLIGESYAVPGTVQSTSLNEAVSKPFFRDVGAMERGVGNLLSPSTYDQAAANFGTQAGIYKTGVPLIIGTSGMMAVDEAQKMKEDADRAAAASKGEQQDMLARIAKGRKRAEEAVRANPYMYAVGGSIDDESGMDEARGLYQGNLTNGLFGGGIPSYAAGGTPRFLSGGGDGMSDSIPATIGGTQEARLADGEFVIPADVVSHLGNGSSKAGAKQLYSMMDRVRKARTGNEKQGRQINPKKLMPA